MNRFQFSMSDLHRIIIAEARNGKTFEELIAYLQSRGWTQEAARHFVHNALHAEEMDQPAVTRELAESQPRLPAWILVLFWLTALTGLLWVLLDISNRLAS